MIYVYFENYMKPINTLCGKNAYYLNVAAGGGPTLITVL
jgi:hypothetical protein